MALFDTTALNLGVGFLLAAAFAYYAKFKAEKGFQWLGVSAVFFLFSAAFAAPSLTTVGLLPTLNILQEIFELLGWLFALIAAVFVAYEVLLEK